jgi:hypothetical protein
MPGDEREKLEDAALPVRQRADTQAREAGLQGRSSTRRIGSRPHEREPGEHIGFGIVRGAAVPKRGFDQAARINPVAIARGVWSSVVC